MFKKGINWKFIVVYILIPLGLILLISTAVTSSNRSILLSPSPLATNTPIVTTQPFVTATPSKTNVNVESSSSLCHSINGLPDSVCTPGIANPNVTQSNIQSTICVSGYTTSIRPSTSYTNNLKTEQIKEYGYSDTNLSDYEEDHLIPLEVGGDPTNPKNLWPEYGKIPNPKDSIENLCHSRVCSGQITLAEAQREIATNWRTACGGSTTIPIIVPAPVTSTPQTNTTVQNNGVTALCNDGTYSYATSHQGACSHHQGVAQFYK